MTLTDKVAQFEADTNLINAWLHGGVSDTITVDSGIIRSPAKLIADKGVEINAGASSVLALSTTQAGIATTQAGLATTNGAAQVSLATAQVGIATEQAAIATSAKTEAESARDAALIQAGVYATEALGRAAVADGQAFKVQGSGDIAALEYRRINSTTSVLIASYPASSAIDAVITRFKPRSAALIPLARAGKDVAVWLDAGKLGAAGLTDSLIAQISTALDNTVLVAGISTLTPRTTNLIPLATSGHDVPLWLDAGKLGAAGLTDSLIAQISTALALQVKYAPLAASPSYDKPLLATDGRSLYQWRAKRAILKRTGAGVIRLLLTGDSWTEQTPISQQLTDILSAEYGQSGAGWIGVASSPLVGVTITNPGWTLYDADSAAGAPLYGSGPDGMAIFATGTAATFSASVRAQGFRIFYWDGNGTWRYRVDGGAWTAVVGTGANAKASLLISGLSDAVHLFEIDTTGNAGTVCLHGFHATRAAAGIELSKCGNGGLQGAHVTKFASQIAFSAAYLSPDVIGIILGTNDYGWLKSIQSYSDGIQLLASSYRAILPNVGIVLIMPAQCGSGGGAGSIPYVQYRDAMMALAQAQGYEYYSAFDEFSNYAIENAAGMWADASHLNDNGGYRLANSFNNRLLGI